MMASGLSGLCALSVSSDGKRFGCCLLRSKLVALPERRLRR